MRNLSTNSSFALGPTKTVIKDFESAGRRTFLLRGPNWSVFSGVPRNTLTSVIHSALPSCLSDHCHDGTALLGKFQSHFRCVRIVAKNASLFPSICLSVHLSPCTSAGPTGRTSVKLEIGECRENLSGNPIFFNRAKISGTLHEDPTMCYCCRRY